MSTNVIRTPGVGYLDTPRWVVVLRGIVAILFGIAIFMRPLLSLQILLLLFGAYVLAGGILALVGGIRLSSTRSGAWWLMLDGLLGIIIGLVTFFWPGITALALLFVIAAWALVTGIFQLLAAIFGLETSGSRFLMGIAGILGIALGAILFSRPAAGVLATVWVIGIYALAFGVLQIILAFMLPRERQAPAL